MRARLIPTLVCLLLAIAAAVLWYSWKRNEPRRKSIHALEHLQSSLNSASSESLQKEVVLPAVLAQRTVPEQSEFIRKVLQDEISPEGIVALRKGAIFGSLREVFPDTAERWAQQAGVKAEDCMAFRMERNGIRAEVVVQSRNGSYRIIRCNNVKQMADTNS